MTNGRLRAGMLAAVGLAVAGSAQAAQCGSALLLEVSPTAVFRTINLAMPTVARFWEAGAAGSNGSDAGCQAGCTSASAAQCAGGGDCLALTGVNWLNASCTLAGHRPLRTVFLVEQATTASGGRWAAINVDRNAGDANTDLDVKAAVICGGCASSLSPLVGGSGRLQVGAHSVSDTSLSATLTWSPPALAAQALSNGPNLVTSYAVMFRVDASLPPSATGDRAGWTFVQDAQADGAANGGFSTDTTASVTVPLTIGLHYVTFSIGLSFDGSGNQTSDPNTRPSTYLSDQSDPLEALVLEPLIFTDDFESGTAASWSAVFP